MAAAAATSAVQAWRAWRISVCIRALSTAACWRTGRHLLQDLGRKPKQAIVDMGYAGVDADNPGLEVIHRGKHKTLTAVQRRWLKRRQAIEPMMGPPSATTAWPAAG